MEKRYERRQDVRLKLVVSNVQGCLGIFPTRNAGPNGLFIETRDLDLGASEVIWLAPPESGGRSASAAVAAVVIHREPNGIGVMLSHPMPSLSYRPRRQDRQAGPPAASQAECLVLVT